MVLMENSKTSDLGERRPREAVDVPSLEAFKAMLDETLGTWSDGGQPAHGSGLELNER